MMNDCSGQTETTKDGLAIQPGNFATLTFEDGHTEPVRLLSGVCRGVRVDRLKLEKHEPDATLYVDPSRLTPPPEPPAPAPGTSSASGGGQYGKARKRTPSSNQPPHGDKP